MSWIRHEYRDKLSGQLTGVEVEPVGDLKPHVSTQDCECIPSLEGQSGALLLIHSAFDGREHSEPNHKKKGH